MHDVQPGILAPIPTLARYLMWDLKPDCDPRAALAALAQVADGNTVVAGLGASTVLALGAEIAALRPFPGYASPGVDVPSTPAALWCWLRGEDRGELLHQTRRLEHCLAKAFVLTRAVDGFRYGTGLDLTGYEDGTENPKGEHAAAAAIVRGEKRGLHGSSFVAVQQWRHNLDHFETLDGAEQDRLIGRTRQDNEEMADAPASAHVKRTAQESFQPSAFVLRRSMPWASEQESGLMFVAFGKSFDAFEALLGRMVGREDGIVDGLFRISRPISGAYYWCPPVRDGRLDLSAAGL
jgi:putative iron-dependent peroxidase